MDGDVEEGAESVIECLRPLHSDKGGDNGVPLVDAGADCIRDGKASVSGV